MDIKFAKYRELPFTEIIQKVLYDNTTYHVHESRGLMDEYKITDIYQIDLITAYLSLQENRFDHG